ncbi:hypothetical protein T03_2669 [Trichinella britovi]|uniref:Uncharacterized protein n=1 Tax=Trichinella britovi TaxID=45882 RepID=A0A0V1D485_TRIBR|nr:hypothetical protein T03_2669 [Trichinella britovi]
MGFQSSYSIPEFIDPHSTPKSVSTPIRPLSLYRPLRESHRPQGQIVVARFPTGLRWYAHVRNKCVGAALVACFGSRIAADQEEIGDQRHLFVCFVANEDQKNPKNVDSFNNFSEGIPRLTWSEI